MTSTNLPSGHLEPKLRLVEGLIVQPGDCLVVRLKPRDATAEAVERLKRDLRATLPDGVNFVVVAAAQLVGVIKQELRGATNA